jgi:hypothetical protein
MSVAGPKCEQCDSNSTVCQSSYGDAWRIQILTDYQSLITDYRFLNWDSHQSLVQARPFPLARYSANNPALSHS